MPVYRCANCKGEAEHPAPGKCEPCGLDPKTEPRAAQLLLELVTIHFDQPHPTVVGWGTGHAACDEKLRVGAGGRAFTGDRAVVNCPACKASAAYAATADKVAMPRDIRIGSLEAARTEAAAKKT